MVRPRTPIITAATAHKAPDRRLSNAERSSYFARREAAKVLRSVLRGDARRRAIGSIKSLVYSPSVRNKKATFALVCQTLKRIFSLSLPFSLSPLLPFSAVYYCSLASLQFDLSLLLAEKCLFVLPLVICKFL